MQTMQMPIVWFKTDLRLRDNETLSRAIENSERVIPVYCFDDQHYRASEFGFRKTGTHRFRFLLESVKDLETSLSQAGSRLLVRTGNPAKALARIAKQYGARKSYAKKGGSLGREQNGGRSGKRTLEAELHP